MNKLFQNTKKKKPGKPLKKISKIGGDTETDTQFFWTLFVVPGMIIFLALSVYVISLLLTSKVTIIEGVKDSAYESRILGSPNCFAYQDELSGRVYNGYIELKKFNEIRFRECFNTQEADQRGIILLLDYDNNQIELTTENVKSKISATEKTTKLLPVHVVKEDGTKIPGLLSIIYWY